MAECEHPEWRCQLPRLQIERNQAIRERDEARARIAELEAELAMYETRESESPIDPPLRCGTFAVSPLEKTEHSATCPCLQCENARLRKALTDLLRASGPVSTCAYNLGQGRNDWQRVILPAIEAWDVAARKARTTLKDS
jgi:hypothetical protein